MLASFIFPRIKEGTSVYKFYFRVSFLVIIFLLPWTVYAAGLGKLTLNSALGQPLKVEIDLVAVENNEISSLTANLASHEAFRQAGITYLPFFSTLQISIEPRANGDSYIKITSPQLVNEPFLNILIELSWASGRLMREYTVLLDPVESEKPELVAPTIRNVPIAVKIRSNESEVPTASVVQQITAKSNSGIGSYPDYPSKTTYGPVTRGDTLSRIAMQVSPQGVSLDQMLIALFRANRDAFIGDNINLLRVGKILRIPSNSEIKSISETEANAQVKVQIVNWRNYQNKLAAASNEQPKREVLKHADAGQITTMLTGEQAASLKGRPEEILRLSSGSFNGDASGGYGGVGSPQDRIQMIEEDSIARSLALIEANERIALLEKNIQNLQRLLELKDPVLAQAQTQAETFLESKVILPSSSSGTDISDETLIIPPQSIEAQSVITPDLSEASEETSLVDQLMRNIEYVGGALVLLLLGILVMNKMRRKKTENETDPDEMDFYMPSPLHSRVASSVVAADSLVSEEVNDVSVDEDSTGSNLVHDTDALVTDEIEDNLNEIDLDFPEDEEENVAASHDRLNTVTDTSFESENLTQESPEFVAVADVQYESDYEIDLDLDLDDVYESNNQTEHGEQLDKVLEDMDIDTTTSLADPETPINEGGVLDQDLNVDLVTAEIPRENSETTKQPATPAANEIDDTIDLDFENATDANESMAVTDISSAETERSVVDNSIAFDLDAPTEASTPEQFVSNESELQTEEKKLDLAIDFPDEFETSTAALSSEDATLMAKPKTAAIIQDLDESPASSAGDVAIEEKGEQWQAVETKIDLAKAYMEMDDSEGAKEILEEVMNEGNPQQKESAKAMLENL
ncbi:MAG: FimV/HubP family polar landmark protein [Nitrosomonas sp.]|nr:FimV/HubP family polar landmark protein [Nitrosomonas sp.]MDP1949505.1 FimV/HubP family polar landmark protein [Nitrosomonas sp.]